MKNFVMMVLLTPTRFCEYTKLVVNAERENSFFTRYVKDYEACWKGLEEY